MNVELLLVKFEGQLCILVNRHSESKLTVALSSPQTKTFSFSLLQFVASEDFVDELGLLKCSKDFQNFRNLAVMLLVNKLEPDWFKRRPLWLKCLPVMFLLSRILIFN